MVEVGPSDRGLYDRLGGEDRRIVQTGEKNQR